MSTEHDLAREVKRWLYKQPNVFAFKINPGKWMRRGLPDIIACVMVENMLGVFVAIELKQPGKKLSDVQTEVQAEILMAGGYYRVCYTLEDVKSYLAEVTKP